MVNGESLFSYKARTEKTTPPASKPRRSSAAVNTQNTAKAKGPKPLTKAEQWLKDNPPNRQGIVDEVKSMLNPRNLTGANAITAAIKGDGMSTTQRITSGLSGVVQGLGFAAGGKAGKVGVEGVKNTGIPARIANKVKGEQVIVHGGKVRGLKQIDPRIPSDAPSSASEYPAVFGVNPSYRVPARGMPEPTRSRPLNMAQIADDYAAGGSIYVAKVPKSSVRNKNTLGSKPSEATIISTSPAKVVKEILDFGSSAKRMLEKQEQILSAAKRAGAKIPKKK